MLQAFLKDDSGATAMEYGFIAGLVSIAILISLIGLGDAVEAAYAQINDGLEIVNGTPTPELQDNVVALEPVLDGNNIAIQ